MAFNQKPLKIWSERLLCITGITEIKNLKHDPKILTSVSLGVVT